MEPRASIVGIPRGASDDRGVERPALRSEP